MHKNEDEPTPLHANNSWTTCATVPNPTANIDTGVRATAIACMGNVAYWTGRKLSWTTRSGSSPETPRQTNTILRPFRKPWDLVKIG